MIRITSRTATALAVVAVLSFAALAARAGASSTAAVKDGGTLTIGMTAGEPDVLDPSLARTFSGREVFLAICEKLYDLNARAQIVPQLAASLPRVSSNKLTVTIALRKGIKFNDGTPFNAQAVKISLDRHKTLKGSTRASELAPLQSVDAVGKYKVVLHLSEPYAPLTAQLADRSGMIMSPAQLDKLGDKFGTNPVCVGPFTFSDRVATDHITVKKSSFYYNKSKVHLNQIVFKVANDPAAAAAALKAGDFQALDGVASTELQGVQSNPKLRIIKSTSLGYQGITFNIGNKNGLGKPYSNVGTPIASHADLRRAFDLALDRRVINKVVFGGTVQPDCHPLAPSSSWYDPSVKCPSRNLALAKKLVKQSGVPTPITVKLMIGTNTIAARVGQVIQSEEQEAGFNVVLQPTEFVTSLRKADNGDYDAFQIGWSGRVDPDGNIYQFVATPGSQNDSGYSNPRLDLILNNARKAQSTGARKKLYHVAQDIIVNKDRPLIYLWHGVARMGVSKNLTGVQLFPDTLARVEFAAFKK